MTILRELKCLGTGLDGTILDGKVYGEIGCHGIGYHVDDVECDMGQNGMGMRWIERDGMG